MILLIIIFLVTLLFYFIYKLYRPDFSYFESKQLKYIKPFTILREMGIWRYNVMDLFTYMYNKYPDEKIIGTFVMRKPTYFIKNPEALNKITIKDFAYFQNRPQDFSENLGEFFNSMLPQMRGKEWRKMRLTLTPIFTGAKMRLMLQLINNCAEQFTNHIREEIEKSGPQIYAMKDLFSKYTNDVIASCAFGVECNSLKNPNNEIYNIGQTFSNFRNPLRFMKVLFVILLPKISKFLGMELFDTKMRKLFQEIILDAMKFRDQHGIVRPDMLNVLMNLKKNSYNTDNFDNVEEDIKKSWTDLELVAQCFLFFIAGFEPTSMLLNFTSYELAVNPDIQEKLIKEIDEMHRSLNGEPLTYEALNKMKYLDMIILESLRKWPPSFLIERSCNKDYVYEEENQFKFTIEQGAKLWLPVYAFHHDPEYFPEPDKFYPERFSVEDGNDHKNLNAAFLPFGLGPRNCIGSRFALMEAKAIFYYILLKFRIKVCSETQVPLKMKKTIFALTPEKEIKLQFEIRQ